MRSSRQSITKLFLSLIIFSGMMEAVLAGAATMRISDIPLGHVIEINGQKFVKVNNDLSKGSYFIALQPFVTSGFAEGMDMDKFTAAMCNSAPTPSANDYFLIGNLVDSRDGKSYEIRKFADGKCWMADNLMYGGITDNCAGVDAAGYTDATYGGANGAYSPSSRFGAHTYGNCRDPRVGAATSSPCYNSTSCGYYYNWQAAMQRSTTYYNVSFSYPTGTPSTTYFYQGICPPGWHLPSGGNTITNSEFAQLDIANGGTGATQTSCTTASCNFWRPGFAYKGIYSGRVEYDGSLSSQGSYTDQWSASQEDVIRSWILAAGGNVYPGTGNYSKNRGVTVRCLKDTADRTMQSFTTADCNAHPTPVGTSTITIGSLKDERDGKWYLIRKFADGKCWMVDNLAYGGGTDGSSDYCANKTTFRSADTAVNASATATNGLNPPDGSRNTLVGDCRNNPSRPTYGYLYNWSAAIQNTGGWYDNSYQPTQPTQGICPQGWHIPTGNTSGEYQALHAAAGSPVTGFWQGHQWRGSFSGRCDNLGVLYDQGSRAMYWTSTQYSAIRTYDLSFDSGSANPANYGFKYTGFAVRCVKN